MFIYINNIPKIAIVVALFETVSDASRIRSDMGNGLDGYHWYSLVLHGLSNIVTFSLFSLYLTRPNKKNVFYFILSFLVSGFTALMATEKAPFVWLVLGLFIVFILVKKRGLISLKFIFVSVFFSIIAVSIMVSIFSGFSFEKSLIAFVSRAFAGSIEPAYHYLVMFPSYEEFKYGRTFNNPGGILPFEPYSYTLEVSKYLSPELAENGIIGSMPTVFWGEAYINFGLPGVFIVSFFMGCFVYFIELLVFQLKDTSLKVGFYVWMLMHYKDLAVSGFSSYVLDIDFIILISLVMFFLLSVNRPRNRILLEK
jgi:oligosaccharide repeat unit polymerase